MPPPKNSWFSSGARFCASCAITLTCWAVWIVLGITLVTLAYVALARDLTVPGFVLRRAEAKLAESGLVLRFGRARFDPTGKVLLEDVQFLSRQFNDPLLTCRMLYVRHNFWTLLAGRVEPAEIRIEGAALQLPAMLSPSGTTEPFVKDLSATVSYENNAWQVDQFIGHIGRLTFTLEGEIPASTRTPGGATPSLDELTGRFLQGARQLAPNLRRLDSFEEPALAVHLGPNRADFLLTARSARQPWDQPVTTGAFAASASLRLNHPGLRPLRVHVAVDHVNYRGQVTAENVRAILRTEVLPESFSGRVLELLATAASVNAANETALGPVIRANLADWPAVRTAALAQIDGEFLAAEVTAQVAGAKRAHPGRGPRVRRPDQAPAGGAHAARRAVFHVRRPGGLPGRGGAGPGLALRHAREPRRRGPARFPRRSGHRRARPHRHRRHEFPRPRRAGHDRR